MTRCIPWQGLRSGVRVPKQKVSVKLRLSGASGNRGGSDRSERRDEFMSTLQVQYELCMIFLIHR